MGNLTAAIYRTMVNMFTKRTCYCERANVRGAIEKKTRRDFQKEDTRRHILKSAYHLFEKNGYDKTTMRQLANHSGVGLGTAFKHFPDKASLLIATFEGDIQSVIKEAFSSIPEANVHMQFEHVLRLLYGYYAKNRALSRVLVKEALFIEGQAGKAIHAQSMLFLEGIARLLQNAAERKEIIPIVDMQLAITGFWSSYLLGLTVGLRDEEFNVEQQVDTVAKLLEVHFPRLDLMQIYLPLLLK